MWITLTEDDLLTRLAGDELIAYREAALAQDQPDPMPETLAAVADEVRGYVAANRANRLGPAGTIPPRLKSAAMDLARYRMATRLPVDVTDERQAEYRNAIRLLERVAAGDFLVEDPDTGASPGGASGVVHKTPRQATRETMEGL